MSSVNKSSNIFINSLPKSGTHLLINVINLLGYRNAATTRSILEKAARKFGFGPPRYLEYEALNDHIGLALKTKFQRSKDADKVPIGVFSTICVPTSMIINWLSLNSVGEYVVGHVPYSNPMDTLLRQLGYKHILIIRDPRAVIVSFHHWIQRPNSALLEDIQHLSKNDQLSLITNGGEAPLSKRHVTGIVPAFRSVLDWTESKNILLIRFEDLIGEQGGGSRETQFNTVKEVCDYLDLKVSKDVIWDICDRAYDTSAPTYRKGKIDAWKRELTPDQIEFLQENSREIINLFGYDKVSE